MIFKTDFSKNPRIPNFMKIRPLEAELFHADGRTDMTKLILAVRNFASAPKNRQGKLLQSCAKGIKYVTIQVDRMPEANKKAQSRSPAHNVCLPSNPARYTTDCVLSLRNAACPYITRLPSVSNRGVALLFLPDFLPSCSRVHAWLNARATAGLR